MQIIININPAQIGVEGVATDADIADTDITASEIAERVAHLVRQVSDEMADGRTGNDADSSKTTWSLRVR